MLFKIAVLYKWQLVKIEPRDQQRVKAIKAIKAVKKSLSLPCMHLMQPLIPRVPGAKVVIGPIRVFQLVGTGLEEELSILYIPRGRITR